MTTRKKISILKRALRCLEKEHDNGYFYTGICSAIWSCDDNSPVPSTENTKLFGIKLPPAKYGPHHQHCWPLTTKGASIRRRVMKNAIKRLEES